MSFSSVGMEHVELGVWISRDCLYVVPYMQSAFRCNAYGFGLYQRACSTHAYAIQGQTEACQRNAMLYFYDKDLLHALLHRHDNTCHGLW